MIERGAPTEEVRDGKSASHSGPGEVGRCPEHMEATVSPRSAIQQDLYFLSSVRAWSRCKSSEGVGRTEACVVLTQAVLHPAAPNAQPTAPNCSLGPPSALLAAGNQCLNSRGYRLQGLEEDRKSEGMRNRVGEWRSIRILSVSGEKNHQLAL